MKRWLLRGGAAAAVLLLCGVFAAALLFYTRPMTEQAYDLSVGTCLLYTSPSPRD